MKILIVDVIGNKMHKKDSIENQEMIEFGAMLFDTEVNQTVAGTSYLVKPHLRPFLSDYCVKKTGITTKDLRDLGLSYLAFVDAIDKHSLLQEYDVWATWGKKSATVLVNECSRHNIAPDFFYYNYIDLQKLFADQYNCGKLKLKQALDMAGIDGVNTSTAYLRASCAAMLARHIDFSEV